MTDRQKKGVAVVGTGITKNRTDVTSGVKNKEQILKCVLNELQEIRDDHSSLKSEVTTVRGEVKRLQEKLSVSCSCRNTARSNVGNKSYSRSALAIVRSHPVPSTTPLLADTVAASAVAAARQRALRAVFPDLPSPSHVQRRTRIRQYMDDPEGDSNFDVHEKSALTIKGRTADVPSDSDSENHWESE